jgi:hypothetical protein
MKYVELHKMHLKISVLQIGVHISTLVDHMKTDGSCYYCPPLPPLITLEPITCLSRLLYHLTF